MNNLVILLFIFGASQSDVLKDAVNGSTESTIVGDLIDINGHNNTIPNVTEVNPTQFPPPAPTNNPNTTSSTTPSTTIPSTTTNGTTTPNPNTTTTTPIPSTTNATTHSTTVKPTTPTTSTTSTSTTPKVTTTVGPVSTTVKPVVPTTSVPEHHRRFDGPSFVGGIVLALGMGAIAFVAFKFYKARTELNYHTL